MFLVQLVSVLMDVGDIPTIAKTTGYGLGFFALVAGYRLARPLALAVLAVNVALAVLAMLGGGLDEMAMVFLGAHVVAMLALLGKDDLAYIRIVGERRAIGAIVLAFYGLAYLVLGYMVGGGMGPALWALAAVYGAAFFALVAGYFWARWFGVGVLLFGIIQGAIGLWQMGPEPVVIFMAASHAIAALALWGAAMAVPYDGQTGWREKFHMDDSAVQRLGRSVIRAGVSLPMVLLYAFAPKPEGMLLGALAVVLATGGLVALVRMRTWGVLALGAAGVTLLVATGEQTAMGTGLDAASLLGGAVLVSVVVPFARAIAGHLRAPARAV
jgi:hypothetical protein